MLPPIDMDQHASAVRGQGDAMKFAFAMMMHVAVGMDDLKTVRNNVQKNTDRIAALEAKVGSSEEIPVPMGLVTQNLPPPGDVDEIVTSFFLLMGLGFNTFI